MTAVATPARVGDLLRDWRHRRRLSQLDLASEAEVSARHLSFVETGRSRPSRELVLHLAEHLDVPLRDRNTLLLAAGFAPAHPRTSLNAPEMAPVRHALDAILAGHEPYPAIIVDHRWDVVSANAAALGVLADGVAPDLLAPPMNALRVALHPDGLPPGSPTSPSGRRTSWTDSIGRRPPRATSSWSSCSTSCAGIRAPAGPPGRRTRTPLGGSSSRCSCATTASVT